MLCEEINYRVYVLVFKYTVHSHIRHAHLFQLCSVHLTILQYHIIFTPI